MPLKPNLPSLERLNAFLSLELMNGKRRIACFSDNPASSNEASLEKATHRNRQKNNNPIERAAEQLADLFLHQLSSSRMPRNEGPEKRPDEKMA